MASDVELEALQKRIDRLTAALIPLAELAGQPAWKIGDSLWDPAWADEAAAALEQDYRQADIDAFLQGRGAVAAAFRGQAVQVAYSSVMSMARAVQSERRIFDVSLELRPRDPRPADRIYRLAMVAWGWEINFRATPPIVEGRGMASRAFLDSPKSIGFDCELVTAPTASIDAAKGE